MIGTILGGRYEIIEEIGNGGMAHVYKAKCTLLNRIVAVKILRDDLEGETEFLKRFNVEAQAAASLTHSNIVSIFDVGCDNDRHYIVMEYVDGITLKDYISEKQRLEYRDALSIAYQISGALQAAHQKNIVHRDIKPHNILVTEEGRIKVTDFGIARSGTHKTLSSNGDIIGSVHYISPEQAKGENVDTRSDIYSLGIVIYEMITGEVPFDGDSPVAIAMKQIEANPGNSLLSELDIPVSVQQIIFKAMAKEPELRYQDAEEIKSDILNVLHDPNFKISDGDLYMGTDDSEQTAAEEKKPKELKPVNSPALKTLLIIGALLTSLLITACVTYVCVNGIPAVLSSSLEEKKIPVPDLSGLTLSEAKQKCSELGLSIVVDDEINDEESEPGVIVSQNPLKGGKLKEKASIGVVINKNEDSFTLDDYIGDDYKEVQPELEDIGCTVNIVFEESKKTTDTILRQSPQSGKKIEKDSVVTLYVSSGVNPVNKYVSVPTLVGKTYSQCISSLSSLGLKIGYSSEAQPGGDEKVVAQSIPSGSMVDRGCTVIVDVEVKEEETENNADDNTSSADKNDNKSPDGDKTGSETSEGSEDDSTKTKKSNADDVAGAESKATSQQDGDNER